MGRMSVRSAAAAVAMFAALAFDGCGAPPHDRKPEAFTNLSDRIRKGAAYECRKAAAPIAVDGRLDEAAWLKADAVDLDMFPWWKEGDGPKQKTAVRMLWDERFLYVGFDCEDADVLGSATERDAGVENDERVEVYLCPDPETEAYCCFEVNSLGTILDYSAKVYRQFDRGWSPAGAKAVAQIRGTRERSDDRDRGWSVELAVPWSALKREGKPMAPDEATVIHVGLYRVDVNMVDGARKETYSMLRSTGTRTPDFHLMSTFVRMVLGGPGE